MTAIWVAVGAVCLWVAYIIGLTYWNLLTYEKEKIATIIDRIAIVWFVIIGSCRVWFFFFPSEGSTIKPWWLGWLYFWAWSAWTLFCCWRVLRLIIREVDKQG